MYKVLIADDEPSICQGLSTFIDWNEFGFQVVDTAEDGEEAMEKLKAGSYNLLLTDIRMPIMDGLELIQNLRKFNQSIRIIVVSGYNDFDFAKKAIKYGVDGYLLKPIDRKELIQYVTTIKGELDEELKNMKLYRDTANMAREKLLYSLVTGCAVDQVFAEKMKHCGISFPYRSYMVALLEAEGLGELMENNPDEAGLLLFSIKNISEEVVASHNLNGYLFEDKSGIVGILFNGDEGVLDENHLSSFLQYIRFCMMKYFNVELTIGLSGAVNETGQVKAAYRQARQALAGRSLGDRGGIVTFAETSTSVRVELEWDVKNLIQGIEEQDHSVIETELDRLMEEVIRKRIPNDAAKALLYNILFEIGFIKSKYTSNPNSLMTFLQDEINALESSRFPIRQFRDILLRVCEDSCSFIKELQLSNQLNVIAKVERYIQEHYSEKISLRTLGATFFMNPMYLGRLFTKSTGVSFNDYLNRIRIQEAKRLLLKSDQKITDIIKNLGYQNQEYFYKIFPKYEGMTFAEYKEACQKKKAGSGS
jgi:two-component system response regulator YesN